MRLPEASPHRFGQDLHPDSPPRYVQGRFAPERAPVGGHGPFASQPGATL
jgi:hypothetical protein